MRSWCGQQDAWRDLLAVCYPRVLAATERLDPRSCDPKDLVTAAFLRLQEGETPAFASLGEMIKWLVAEVQRAGSGEAPPSSTRPAS